MGKELSVQVARCFQALKCNLWWKRELWYRLCRAAPSTTCLSLLREPSLHCDKLLLAKATISLGSLVLPSQLEVEVLAHFLQDGGRDLGEPHFAQLGLREATCVDQARSRVVPTQVWHQISWPEWATTLGAQHLLDGVGHAGRPVGDHELEALGADELDGLLRHAGRGRPGPRPRRPPPRPPARPRPPPSRVRASGQARSQLFRRSLAGWRVAPTAAVGRWSARPAATSSVLVLSVVLTRRTSIPCCPPPTLVGAGQG